jgi:hypothetical protein
MLNRKLTRASSHSSCMRMSKKVTGIRFYRQRSESLPFDTPQRKICCTATVHHLNKFISMLYRLAGTLLFLLCLLCVGLILRNRRTLLKLRCRSYSVAPRDCCHSVSFARLCTQSLCLVQPASRQPDGLRKLFQSFSAVLRFLTFLLFVQRLAQWEFCLSLSSFVASYLLAP